MQVKKLKQPTSAVMAVTYRCNSRCQMCNIWQKQPEDELAPSAYLRLPKSLDDINLTGGEPFLRDDLMAIVDSVMNRCQPSKLVISTNGYLTAKIIATAREIMKRSYNEAVTIALSLDGIGEVHDKIRGIPGAYQMAINTINGLQSIGFNKIGLGFTFMAGNESEYEKVYDFSKKMNLNFGATIAHNADNYFSTQTNNSTDPNVVEMQVEKTIQDKIKTFSKIELGKCYYLHGLAFWSRYRQSILPCNALSSSFFLDPQGNIYPCNILNKPVGNLKTAGFNDIWNCSEAEKIRQTIKNCPSPCWMVCTGKPAIKKHWFKAGMWILKRKLNIP